ncbi:MAG: TraR/DksA C4-type zinc finger protein [Candidatus Pacebacteria bacterium]|nr:TraR/DksA C4-type zinc finger protein [Candidatus Paceibacterota bacterium]
MTDINTYKAKLEEEKASLETQLQDVGRPDPSNPGSWEGVQKEPSQEADPNDQASSLDEYQENRAIVDVLNARHHAVTEALARIEDGTYGTCVVCGNPIEEDRLAADPAANTCKEHLS